MARHKPQSKAKAGQNSESELQTARQRISALESSLAQANADLQAERAARERLETALSDQQTLLHTVIDNLPDFIYFKDSESRIILDNVAHARTVGLTPSEMVGKADADIFPPEWAAAFYADEQAVIRSGQPLIEREEQAFGPNMQAIWALTTKVPVRGQDGQIIGIVGITRDITKSKLANEDLKAAHESLARKVEARTADLQQVNEHLLEQITKRERAEKTLADERNLLRTLLDNLPDRIYAKDRGGQFTLKNLADAHQMGAGSTEEVIGKTDFDYYPSELAQLYHADDQAVIQSGQALINREEPFTMPDGTQGWMLTSKVPLRDDQGNVTGLVGIGRDVTGRKQVEDALIEERNLLRTLIDTIPDGIYVKDSQSRFLIANVAHRAGLVVPDQRDIVGKTDFDFFPREEAERFFAIEQGVIQTGVPLRHHEERATDRLTGQVFWLDDTKSPLRDRNGQIVGIVGISYNITSRKQTEEALRQSEARFRTLIEEAPVAIAVVHGQLPLYFNHALLQLFDYTNVSELPDPLLIGLLASQEETRIRKLLEDPNQTFPVTLGLLGQRKDGSMFPLLLQIGKIILQEDHAYIFFAMDLSTHKRLEEERVIAERLRLELEKEKELSDLKDRFISMVSHEFQTPLSIIHSSTELLLNYADQLPPDKRVQALKRIYAQVKYMAGLVDNVLNIGKVQAGKVGFNPQMIDVENWCQEEFDNLELADHEQHKLILVMEPGTLGRAQLDERFLRQIVSNLVTNAAKYSAADTKIRLEVRREEKQLVFQISDEGIGIPVEDAARLFEPFHRAENVANISGAGLGLAIVKSNVEAHDGSITFESKLGVGTTFTVRLPIVEDLDATGPSEVQSEG